MENRAFRADGEAFSVTVSLGVAGYREGDDASTLIRRADEALYLAKERGRNRFAVADD